MATRRKQGPKSSPVSAKKRSRKTIDLGWTGNRGDDEQIDSDNESEDEKNPSYKDESEEDDEDLDVKKVRLARKYLEKLKDESESESSSDDDSVDDNNEGNDAIGRRLQKERLKREGLFERPLASKIEKSVTTSQHRVIELHKRPALAMLPPETASSAWVETGVISLLKGHDLTPTCVALQASGEKALSGSKDHSVILWDVEKQTRLQTLVPHWKTTVNNSDKDVNAFRKRGQVLAVACSDDGRYAAIGKNDSTISIFDIRTKSSKGCTPVKTFRDHKGAITCLTFRTHSNQLFSGSDDRCIRHFSLDEMICMETLYGHQFGVTSIDCHRKELPISVSTDRTARAWKLQEDTHLIFRGGATTPAADCVTVIKDDWFVSGHQDGALSLWMTTKKRAAANIVHAHGKEGSLGRSIVSVDCVKGSDIVASGSYDGYVRFWRADTGRDNNSRGLNPLTQIPVFGFINGIAFGPKGRFCIAAVGQEHRLGRWETIKRAKNRIAIIKIQNQDEHSSDEESENSVHSNIGEDALPANHNDSDSE